MLQIQHFLYNIYMRWFGYTLLVHTVCTSCLEAARNELSNENKKIKLMMKRESSKLT